jgi:hypothetical protein
MMVFAQWESVGGGMPAGQPYDLHFDSAQHRLYMVGNMNYLNGFSVRVNGTAYYENGTWHPMRSGSTDIHNVGWVGPEVRAICAFDSALIAAGSFYQMDSVPSTSFVAEWRNEEWHSMGIDSSEQELNLLMNLIVLNGKVNLLGAYNWVVDGVPIRSWGTWDGQTWGAGDTSGIFYGMQLNTISEYQGQVYAGGNFDNPGFPSDIARWNTDHWEEVGGGINGDPWVNDLAVYNDKLWVCGEFAASWGNAASGLMAWDGQQWLDPFPQIQFTAAGKNVSVIGGRLVFTGPIHVNGLAGEYRIGVYDGSTLCIIGGPGMYAERIAGNEDTLFVQTCYNVPCNDVNGPYIGLIGKLPFNTQPDTCFTISQSIQPPAQAIDTKGILHPNPATEMVHVDLPSGLLAEARTVRITDMLGKLVAEQPHIGTRPITVPIELLAHGSYSMLVLDKVGQILFAGRFIR